MTELPPTDPTPETPGIPAGWYTNSSTARTEWWDGSKWTGQLPPTAPATQTPSPTAPRDSLAIIALVAGGVAFLLGLVPVLGIVLGLVAVCVAVFALIKSKRPKWMVVIGIVAGSLALISSIATTTGLANGGGSIDYDAKPAPPVVEQTPAAPATTPTPEPPTLTMGQTQAVQKANAYLRSSAFSRTGLIDQLIYEGFSTEDSTFAVDNITVDWNEQAAAKAQSYINSSSFSRQGLIDQLLYEGFSAEQAEYGVAAVGY